MKKIYVVGSINTDLVINTPYMPKAGETLTGSGFFTARGGKGANQAVACAKMKSKVKMIAKVGNDAFSSTLKSELKSFGVNVQNVISEPCVSGVALITVQGGDNSIIVGGEANMRLTNNDVDNALKTATANDVLVAQLEIPIEVVEYAFNLAKKKTSYHLCILAL
jgi:ribokinase